MRALTLIAGLVLALPAGATDVYRCINANGRVEYRDSPCTGMKGQKVELEPLNVMREIDQSAARAASDAIAARAAARAAADQADAERRRMQALEAQRAAQADADAGQQVPPYGYWEYPVTPVKPDHRPKPKRKDDIPRAQPLPQSLPQQLPVEDLARRR
jgi:hypothetical protein